jgi:hypothetical protein
MLLGSSTKLLDDLEDPPETQHHDGGANLTLEHILETDLQCKAEKNNGGIKTSKPRFEEADSFSDSTLSSVATAYLSPRAHTLMRSSATKQQQMTRLMSSSTSIARY